jgi:uncharacterized protein YjbI with pentapeptide repeats
VTEAQFYHARLQHVRFNGSVAVSTNFSGSKLDNCNFAAVDLRGAKFTRAEILQCSFREARLEECDFREVRLRGGNFDRAVLAGARFAGAQLRSTDFRGTNLQDARELTPQQLLEAITDRTTILPNGTKGPYMRASGAERPKQATPKQEKGPTAAGSSYALPPEESA